jgi:DNA end-binding protein Ku
VPKRRPEERSEGPASQEDGAAPRLRPMWSGTIAFGLVSLPVALYPANRSARVALRLVDEEGVPLSRRYVSSVDGRPLDPDDIVRGYPVDDDFFVVEDEELEALAPERSQEIDLSRFVEVGEVDPSLFERGYFLAPQRGAVKAYRLLARAMEDADRAGIATFVMRGKEYLVAIVAEDGILRAETLRFPDELRSPDEVGLPPLGDEVDEGFVRRLVRAVDELADDHLDRSLLADRGSEALLELVREKLAAGEGVVPAPDEERGAVAPDESEDLMALLKRSLEEDDEEAFAEARPAGSGARDREEAADLARLDKATLYARAQEADLPGRSRMTKEELVAALRRRPGR